MSKPTAIDLFAGAGGFSLGLVRAGYDIALANEYSVSPQWTYVANLLPAELPAEIRDEETAKGRTRPFGQTVADRKIARGALERQRATAGQDYDKVMRGGDIREVLGNKWLNQWLEKRESREVGPIDLLVAGPPCQGFSHAGRRQSDDERNDLVSEAVRVIKAAKPRMFLIENVPGMLSGGGWERLHQVGRDLARADDDSCYVVVASLLDTSDYGVPQTRKRLVLAGLRQPISSLRGQGEVQVRELREQLGQLVYQGKSDWLEANLPRGQEITGKQVFGDLLPGPRPYGESPAEGQEYNPKKREHDEKLAGLLLRGTREEWGFDCALDAVQDRVHNHEATRHHEEVIDFFRDYIEVAKKDDGKFRTKTLQLKRRYQQEHEGKSSYKNKKKNVMRVVLEDKPLDLTVTSLPDDIILYHGRIPTVRELARLQAFPDWFVFKGVRTTGHTRRREGLYVPQYTQVANAVPPPLAYALGVRVRKILDHLEAHAGHLPVVVDLDPGFHEWSLDKPSRDFSARTKALNDALGLALEKARKRTEKTPRKGTRPRTTATA